MRNNFAHPLFLYAFCRPERSRRTCATHVIQTERSERKDLIALDLLPSKKEEWKTAHANKNAFAAFSIPLFCPTLTCPERQPVVLSAAEGPVLPVIPHVTSSGSREVCWQRQIPRLRSFGPTLGMTGKAKTVGKRNSFPGFSFFDGQKFCFHIFLTHKNNCIWKVL